jgi:hypothetical protein
LFINISMWYNYAIFHISFSYNLYVFFQKNFIWDIKTLNIILFLFFQTNLYDLGPDLLVRSTPG